MKYFVTERTVDDMQKKNRGKRIIMAVTVAAVLAVVVILLVCGGSNVGANAPGNKKTAEQEQL